MGWCSALRFTAPLDVVEVGARRRPWLGAELAEAGVAMVTRTRGRAGEQGGRGWSRERRRPGRAGRRQLGSYRARLGLGGGKALWTVILGFRTVPGHVASIDTDVEGEGQARTGSVLGGVAAALPGSGCARVGAQGRRSWASVGRGQGARGSWAGPRLCCAGSSRRGGEGSRWAECARWAEREGGWPKGKGFPIYG